jgi:hypothetical protein
MSLSLCPYPEPNSLRQSSNNFFHCRMKSSLEESASSRWFAAAPMKSCMRLRKVADMYLALSRYAASTGDCSTDGDASQPHVAGVNVRLMDENKALGLGMAVR